MGCLFSLFVNILGQIYGRFFTMYNSLVYSVFGKMITNLCGDFCLLVWFFPCCGNFAFHILLSFGPALGPFYS